jgi:hypothetical protein
MWTMSLIRPLTPPAAFSFPFLSSSADDSNPAKPSGGFSNHQAFSFFLSSSSFLPALMSRRATLGSTKSNSRFERSALTF